LVWNISMNPMNRLVGILLIILSAAAFGTLGILGRFAFAERMDSLSIMALQFSLAALVLLVLLLFRGERIPRGGTLVSLVGLLTLIFAFTTYRQPNRKGRLLLKSG
jgi:drug/metabolite transporter (DMT)-like permease